MNQAYLVLVPLAASAVASGMLLVDGMRRSRDRRAGEEKRERARRADAVRAAMEFDLSQVRRRYMRETGQSEASALAVEREFRRFVGLMASNPRVEFGLRAPAVDAYWHAALECTATYRAYCKAAAGRFIDHDPEGGLGNTYARTWEAYRLTYGETPPVRWWPRPTASEMRRAGVVARGSGRSSTSSSGGDDGFVPALFFADEGGSGNGHGTGHSGTHSASHASHGQSDGAGHGGSDGGSHSTTTTSCSGSSCSGSSCGGGGE